MKTRHVAAPRGQALVETALGVVVVGAVLVAAIHFAEVGFVGLKVQEAAAAGLWESTGGLMHHMPEANADLYLDCTGAACPEPALVPARTADVQARYADFDGRTGTAAGPFNQMYANASAITMNCQVGAAPLAGRGVTQGGNGGLLLNPIFIDNRGLSCGSEATVNTGAFFPLDFFEAVSGGFFGTDIAVMKATNLKVCGLGRPSAGACSGRYDMMLDDWALQGEEESGLCLILQNAAAATGCSLPLPSRNPKYHQIAKRAYEAVPGAFVSSGSAYAWSVVGWSPIAATWPVQDENEFFLSASGEEMLFTQPPAPPVMGWPLGFAFKHFRAEGFGTTPGGAPPMSYMATYLAGYIGRSGCFLGRPCN